MSPALLTHADVSGTWELLEYGHRFNGGPLERTFGDDPLGYLTYTPDGRMWAAVGLRRREPFGSEEWFEVTRDERLRVVREYSSYCGRYDVEPGRVIHHPDMSLNPNRIGNALVRNVELSGDRLVFSTSRSLLSFRRWRGTPPTRTDLVGTWAMVTYEHAVGDGPRVKTFGDDPLGYLTYTEDGRMWAAFGLRKREPFAGEEWFGPTPDEQLRIMKEYGSYCGRYELGPGRVIHQVEMSLYPNRIGKALTRFVELSGDDLTVTTPKSRLTLRRWREPKGSSTP